MADGISTRARRLRAYGRKYQFQAFVVAGGAMVLALLWAGLGYHLHLRRESVVAQTHRDVRTLSAALEQQVERLLVGVDQAMRFMQADYARDPAAFRLEEWMRRATSLRLVANGASLYDAEGNLLAARPAPDPAQPSFDVRDRDYFRALAASGRPDAPRAPGADRDDPAAPLEALRGLYVDRTLRGRITGRHALQVARRLDRADGGFAGVLLVSLDPDHLAEQFRALDIGHGGSVALFGHDGRVRARHPAAADMYERDASAEPAQRAAFGRMRADAAGSFQGVSAYDGVERVFGYHAVAGLPLVVTVGKAVSEVMGPFASERRRVLAAGGAASLAILAALAGLVRELERRRRRAAALEAAEAGLREKTRLLEVTLEAMDQGLIMVDAGGTVQVANRRASALLRLPAELMAGTPSYRAVRDHARRSGAWGRLAEDAPNWILDGERRSQDVRCERRTRDGRVLEIRSVPTSDDGVVQTFTDISHLKAAEAQLRASEARYRLLADNASDLIVLGHADGRRTYISPAVTRLLGYTVEEAHAVRMRDWVHPDDLAGVFATTTGLDPARPTGAVVYRLRRKDGRYIWAEAAFRRAEDPATGEVTIVTAIRDVSERQARAEELRLAKEAAERARARAEHEGRAKADFLAAMSHEIRTPLNAIIGFTDLILARDDLAPDLRARVALVEGAGAALLTIVDDVLDFSKMEAGEVELAAEPFSPVALAEGALAILRPQAEAKGLALALEVAPGRVPGAEAPPPMLVGDADRLRQVLLNLVGNAVKFTRAGAVTLRLAVEEATSGDDGVALRVAVVDTGIGIPADKRHRLFERFSQVDGSVRREFGGTGLGLAICKHLVALMGGAIGVESEEGRGSTFWFTLRLPRAAAPRAPTRPVAAPGAAPERRTAAHLLLAEDLPINQELARLVLERAGYTLDVVPDGAAALAAVQARAYDLVLMDVQMPVMDGITATEAIRALDGPAARLPIVAMSANVLPEQIARFRRAGMDDHVGKPFRIADLVAAIERGLANGTARATGAA